MKKPIPYPEWVNDWLDHHPPLPAEEKNQNQNDFTAEDIKWLHSFGATV